jgi:site-specific DNA recombinase
MIRNEKYTGNALLQKKYVSDYMTKTLLRNKGELPKYYAKATHPAIIDIETFQKAQDIYESNKKKSATKNPSTRCYPFSGMIYCPHCGKNYRRKKSNNRAAWNCSTYLNEGKAVCHTKQIPEETLISTTNEVLGISQFDETVLKNRVKRIVVPEFNVLIYILNDGQQVKRIWKDRSRRESWDEAARQKARERELNRRGEG